MPTVIATPGAANANSYVTVEEATAYVGLLPSADGGNTRPGEIFEEADTADKERAVILASLLLDANIPWLGAAATTIQSMAWPRVGLVSHTGAVIPADQIPTRLKYATAEFARQLLMSDRLSDNDVARQGITSIKAGQVTLQFNKDFKWNAETPIVIPDAVRSLLVPTWYVVKNAPAILKVL
jgi:hypothetical protein